eukprot:CAMPEP_0116947974 /NCGR_PEP_ID=MMETSP0467-20121206/38018_1 /TAXON_ID=283647 /ORGANISM="Mesodinium pulex, Strain SPMC105" /LENGTH=87 /DNA_ID=CAMNT_0004632281 /DNA_START=73 /DNA_END=336 /DNA_ORIENTATION=+
MPKSYSMFNPTNNPSSSTSKNSTSKGKGKSLSQMPGSTEHLQTNAMNSAHNDSANKIEVMTPTKEHFLRDPKRRNISITEDLQERNR